MPSLFKIGPVVLKKRSKNVKSFSINRQMDGLTDGCWTKSNQNSSGELKMSLNTHMWTDRRQMGVVIPPLHLKEYKTFYRQNLLSKMQQYILYGNLRYLLKHIYGSMQ